MFLVNMFCICPLTEKHKRMKRLLEKGRAKLNKELNIITILKNSLSARKNKRKKVQTVINIDHSSFEDTEPRIKTGSTTTIVSTLNNLDNFTASEEHTTLMNLESSESKMAVSQTLKRSTKNKRKSISMSPPQKHENQKRNTKKENLSEMTTL